MSQERRRWRAPKRRTTIPQELDDLEDVRVNQESFGDIEEEEKDRMQSTRSATTTTTVGGVAEGRAAGRQPGTAAATTGTTTTAFLNEQVQKLPKEVRNLLAGGMAGMTAKSVVAPFDRIKILFQVSNVPFHLRELPNVMKRIVQTEGLDALWKGNFATMVRVFPYSGIQFMTYDRIKGIFLNRQRQQQQLSPFENPTKLGLTPIESLMAGMTAGTTSVICTYPLDLTRAQLAVLKKHKRKEHVPNKSFVTVLQQNYQQRGFPGLWRGITPTIIGILPYSGIAFTLNEQGKREIVHYTGQDLTTIQRMICGAIAGLIAQTLTYPIEVTRRRMQTVGLVGNDTALGSLGGATGATRGSGGGAASLSSSVATGSAPTTSNRSIPPTLIGTIRDVYIEQGISGFYKGVTSEYKSEQEKNI